MTRLQDIELKNMPRLDDGLLFVCFDGWGNALDISMGMAKFLIRALDAAYCGRFDTDPFYILKERRPVIEVVDGNLRKVIPPTCELFAAQGQGSGARGIMILKGEEPDIQWFRFADNVISLCRETGIKTVVSCGGMLDNTHYADTRISVVVSDPALLAGLPMENPSLINYAGQSSIHSTLHFAAKQNAFDCIGFYCHCPAYLQGITHYGLLAHLGKILSSWAGFDLNTEELSVSWLNVKKQIQEAIDQNPELKVFVNEIKKNRGKTDFDPPKKDDKVINLEDYLKL